MKWFAALLMMAATVLGAVASLTAYLPTVATVRASRPPLSLNGPAGRQAEHPDQPLLKPGTSPVLLTAERLDQLERAGVRRVTVKEFAWSRWDGRYPFLLALAGLAAGAVLMRRAARRELDAAWSRDRAGTRRPPAELLALAIDEIERLIAATDNSDDAVQSAEVGPSIAAILEHRLQPIVEQQTRLIGQMGLAAYARLMDRFAAGERKLNRAWSATVDRVPEEVRCCLRDAVGDLAAARAELERTATSGGTAGLPSGEN
ncbi:MAG: hypothetical protein ACC645_14710 [Pirellulales bacterium]